MAHPYMHAQSSARKWGGTPEDYLAVHDWFDASKQMMPDYRHRAVRHHSEGIFLAERVFGHTLTNSAGRRVPVRYVAEQHVKEDLGFIPTVQDWLTNLAPQAWMLRGHPLETERVGGVVEAHGDVAAGERVQVPPDTPTRWQRWARWWAGFILTVAKTSSAGR